MQNKGHVVSGVKLIEVESTKQLESMITAVSRGLSQTQKSLPCWLFYDTVGSELFEKICQLPEYHITRTEKQILQAKAAEIIQGFAVAVVKGLKKSDLDDTIGIHPTSAEEIVTMKNKN